jgi:hypothetical protein
MASARPGVTEFAADPEDEALIGEVDAAREMAALGVDVYGWWLRFWARLELSDAPGFAVWGADAFGTLGDHFAQLSAVFHHYARVGARARAAEQRP